MREHSRALVLKDSKVLAIRRNNFGKVYTVLPGGEIEKGESAEEACVREVFEETSIRVKVSKKLFETIDQFGKTTYFLTEYLSGEPKLSPESPEYQTNLKGLNTFMPIFLPIDSIDEEPFFEDSKKAINLSGIITKRKKEE